MPTYFKLSPELSDGSSFEITDNKEAILEQVKNWLDEFGDIAGEQCEISTVQLTKEDFEKIPEL